MRKLSLTTLAVAAGSLALSAIAGTGVASADPDLDPIINTTCSYPQVISALNASNPEAAAQFNASPLAQSGLQRFLASPPSQRLQMIQQVQGSPRAQQMFGLVEQVAATCNNY